MQTTSKFANCLISQDISNEFLCVSSELMNWSPILGQFSSMASSGVTIDVSLLLRFTSTCAAGNYSGAK
jgi:hypothetical protein